MRFNIFGSKKRSEDLRAKIDPAIKKLEVYKREISLLKRRVEDRRERLFMDIIMALQNNEKDKATIYANEHAEVKKIIKVLNACDVALSQIIVRLESIRDVGEVMRQIDGAFRIAKSLSKDLVALPQELAETTNNLQEELMQIMSELGQLSPTVSIAISEHSTDEIIEEAMNYIEERSRQVFSDPLSAPPVSKIIDEAKLLAAGEGGQEEPFRVEVYKTPTNDVEEKLFNYIVSHGGDVKISEMAANLGMSVDEVERTVFKLVQTGRLKVKGG